MTIPVIRQYMRDNTGRMVVVSKRDGSRVSGLVHDAGIKAVWLVTPASFGQNALDHIVKYDDVLGYLSPVPA